MDSPFLQLPQTDWVTSNELAFAIRDRYPVTPGHTLVVTRRVATDYFTCTLEERRALLDLVEEVKLALDREFQPAGYNVGFNSGAAAGQTVLHVHVHVIPRYRGDMSDPRGGVRHVIPEKGNYLRERVEQHPPGTTPRREEPLYDGEDDRHLFRGLAPLLAQAGTIDILAAFVQTSGLDLIQSSVFEAVKRGAAVRLITGDYLGITSVAALTRLLDWAQETRAESGADEAEFQSAGRFEVRVVEHEVIRRAFHPKSWRLEGPGLAVAFVGSSNVSWSALREGVEWNLRIDRDRDPAGYGRVAQSFQRLWERARELDVGWIAAYAERARVPTAGEDAEATKERALTRPEPPPALPQPNELQREALEALALARVEGRSRAVVVMATGLGKTVLAALDLLALHGGLKRMPRVLWVVHRRELLRQARDTLRKAFPEARFGWLLGGQRPVGRYDVLLASIQTLARARIAELGNFDYLVIDEVHHAHAPSYRRLLDAVQPGFLLGLTATPERADGGDILASFDEHIAYRADIGEGIAARLLVPFAYFGLKDVTDYRNVPWRNGDFSREELGQALATQVRMEKLWSSWHETGRTGTRTLVFCASIRHAEFVRDWLRDKGVKVALCHGSPGSDDRTNALEDLEVGRIEAICCVDLFNEGIDCPPLDRVVMLRPTSSPVIFLQQLGRGLRTAEGKQRLVVLDFMGNHRVFLDRLRVVLALSRNVGSLRAALETGRVDLLDGCSLEIELEAIDLLSRLMPRAGASEAVRVYRDLRAARDRRPSAGEMVRQGLSLGSLRRRQGGWFDFLDAAGDLEPAEQAALKVAGEWLRELEKTAMTKCFKMVVLEVLLEADALFEGLELGDLARRSHAYLVRSPELMRDLEGVKDLPDPRNPAPEAWLAYWIRNPIEHWSPSFEVEGGQLTTKFLGARPPPDGELREAIVRMTRELVDARLAEYRARPAHRATGDAIPVKVMWNQRDPILKLPDGAARGRLPWGDTDVHLPDGSLWRFAFRKIAVNVACPVGQEGNALPELLRGWFGPGAGMPGTAHHVLFRGEAHDLRIEPIQPVPSPDEAT